ncbi:MAG: radical SAM protein [Candidatus Aureabacteria bacterium]|nr:radical SAM protein [Candidatus Auribacterota bacterium]
MATRSILINYAGYPFTPSSLMPDNGLANLAGALINAGHETLILDYGTVNTIRRLYPLEISKKTAPIYHKHFCQHEKKVRKSAVDLLRLMFLNKKLEKFQEKVVSAISNEIIKKIKEFRPNFIGFKLWTGDGFTGSIKIAQNIKRAYPSLRIYAGGPHVDIFGTHIFSTTNLFDALVRAEGEEVILSLTEHCIGKIELSKIPNIIYKDGVQVKINEIKWINDLNSLPFPVYDERIYPSMEGNQKIKIIVIDESRGCPYGCAFCIQPVRSGCKTRLKSPQRVVDEISRIVSSLGITTFRYAGSATPLRHAVNIAQLILKEGLNITYSAFGHIEHSCDDDYLTLRRSGCRSIFFGIESGSREILSKGFEKKIDPELTRRELKACRKAGIFTIGSIIFPSPFESDETEKETLDLLLDAKPNSVPVQFPGIIPGTRWRLYPEKYNFQINTNNYEEKLMNYKIKLLYPPRYWSSLPYHVNNMGYRQFMQKSEEFAQKVELAGMPTNIADELVLMALKCGYQGKEKVFRDELRYSFAAGDIEFISHLVDEINCSTTTKSL